MYMNTFTFAVGMTQPVCYHPRLSAVASFGDMNLYMQDLSDYDLALDWTLKHGSGESHP